MSTTRNYGTLKSIEKNGLYGTVTIDGNINLRVKFNDLATCAYTGKAKNLQAGDKLSFNSTKENHLLIATDIHIFNFEKDAQKSFDATKSIADPFYEITQRESRFANKFLGIVAREDVSKYGSISLYDGYSDEDYS